MAVFDFMKRREQGGSRQAPHRWWDETAASGSAAGGHNPAAALAAMRTALNLAGIAGEQALAAAPSSSRQAHPDRPAQRERAVFIGGVSRM